MQFRTFTWPNDPETLSLSYRRAADMLPGENGLWTLENQAQLGRVVEGEGVFFGPDAYDSFRELSALMQSGISGSLTLPHWGQMQALMTQLSVTETAGNCYLKYRFTFLEPPA